MPYGCSPSSRYRWSAAREPDTFHYGPFSPATEDRYSGFLALGLVRRHRGPRRHSSA